MALDPVTAGIDLVSNVGSALIKHFFPDKQEQAKYEAEMDKLRMSGVLENIAGQLKINAIEAASPNMFIAGWRPAVGWVGVISLALVYWPHAILVSFLWAYQAFEVLYRAADVTKVAIPAYPDLGLSDILGLLASILGIGTMRTVEKVKDAEGNR